MSARSINNADPSDINQHETNANVLHVVVVVVFLRFVLFLFV